MNAHTPPELERALSGAADRHGVSRDAALAMLAALRAGNGTMAQFSIPELGGSGQWMRGGMTMVGNMFDDGLKARVDALCNDLLPLLTSATPAARQPTAWGAPLATGTWWPEDLGHPDSSGGQNDSHYAVFADGRRLAIQTGGVTRVFDTGEHRIGGVQQQQGGSAGTVQFTSQLGTFDVSSLLEVGVATASSPSVEQPGRHAATERATAPVGSAPTDAATIIASIESLASLHARGVLSDEEFTTKKAELLSRL